MAIRFPRRRFAPDRRGIALQGETGELFVALVCPKISGLVAVVAE